MFPIEIKNTLENCLCHETPFALFRFPGEREWHFAGKEGYSLRLNEYNTPLSEARTVDSITEKSPAFNGADKMSYKERVDRIVDFHRRSGFGKTVFSRVIEGETELELLIVNAESLFDMNPDAFCLLAMTAAGEVWLMATPELLLDMKGSRFTTMALAGTRMAGSHEPWDTKNNDEHSIVRNYICDSLDGLRIEYEVSETKTRKSNNVEHLCTMIEGCVDSDINAETILDTLSPTPAVCGYPREDARVNISNLEDHPRRFYTGYTVVTTPDGELRAFVNLRCACIDTSTGRFLVYTGGGITKDSDSEDEWNETQLKAASLVEVLERKREDKATKLKQLVNN